MSSRGIARRFAGAAARATAVVAVLFILAVPVIALAADPTSAPPAPTVAPIGGGGTTIGQTSGATCDTQLQLPMGIQMPNVIVPRLPIEACQALGYKDASNPGAVNGYATLMTLMAFASTFWLLWIIGKLAFEMVMLYMGKKDEYGTEEKAGALFGHFSRQLIASFIVAIVGFIIFSNGIQIVLAIGNGGIGVLGVSSNGSYLKKFGGPLIGGWLLWMQNAGSMVLLLVAVPIAAFRFLRAYSKITLGSGEAEQAGDFAAINSHLKSTFYFLVAIALAWIGIRFGIDIAIGLWTNISGGGSDTGLPTGMIRGGLAMAFGGIL